MDSNSAGTFQKFYSGLRPFRHNSCLGEIKFSPSGLLPETNQAAARILGSYPFHTGFLESEKGGIYKGQLSKKVKRFFRGLDCSYKLCTACPIKSYHGRVSRTGFGFPIAQGYKLTDKPVQSLYGLVLQLRSHSSCVILR